MSEIDAHKDLFPLEPDDYWGFFFVCLGLMVAASGGIGGGGILVPILILVFNFPPKYAIPLSNFTIFGASISNVYLNMPKRHPNADRPLVDWDLIVMMEPLTMFGAILGSYIGKILPDELLVLLLVLLLGATSHRTLKKGIKQWNDETKALSSSADLRKISEGQVTDKEAMAAALKLLEEEQEDTLLDKDSKDSTTDSSNSSSSSNDTSKNGDNSRNNSEKEIEMQSKNNDAASCSNNHIETNKSTPTFDDIVDTSDSTVRGGLDLEPGVIGPGEQLDPVERQCRLNTILDREKNTPKDKVILMCVMFKVVVVLNLIKGGGKGHESVLSIACGGPTYWLITITIGVWLTAIMYYVRDKMVLPVAREKRFLGYEYAIGDVRWNARNTIVYPIICILAGLAAGMFGIGGGIVKGPLMLELGVHPLVASASVAVMIFFTSIAATTSFMAFGTLKWDYGWMLFSLGLICTAVGQMGVGYLVKKYKRVSLISLSIASVVALSTLLMALHGVISLTDESDHEENNNIC